MTVDALLSIDVGLTNVKAVAFDPRGRLLARSSVAYRTRRPIPDAVEQAPAAWWSAVTGAVRRLPRAVRGSAVGIGVTAHMHALVLVGPDGDSLGPALVLGDRRAAMDALELTQLLGADNIYAATGAELDASMPAAKARFVRREWRDEWVRTRWLLGCKDYIRLLLTGEVGTEPIDACATSLFNIRTSTWWPPLIEATGVADSMLPPVLAPWAVAGRIWPSAAETLGLEAGLPVAIGAGDDVIVLGFGLLDPGVAMEHIGTTGSIMAVADRPLADPLRGLELYPHVLPDRWVIGGSHTTAGAALGWVARLLGYPSVRAACEALEQQSAQENIEFLPTLAGERFPARVPAARGAWVSMPLTVTREALMYAAFEGVAGALNEILTRIDLLAGHQTAVCVTGSDDSGWLSLRARAYRRPLTISASPEPTALGLATLIAVAAGLFPDVRAAVGGMTDSSGVLQPDEYGHAPSRTAELQLRSAWQVADHARRAMAV